LQKSRKGSMFEVRWSRLKQNNSRFLTAFFLNFELRTPNIER
jgi:hypothetical protein